MKPLPPIFAAQDALEAGYTRKQLERKSLINISNNVYLNLLANPTYHETVEAFARANPQSVVSSISAAHLHKMRLPSRYREPDQVYLNTINYASDKRTRGIKAIRKPLRNQEIIDTGDYLLATPERTLLDLAAILSVNELTCVIDGLLVHHQHRTRQRYPMLYKEDLENYLVKSAGKHGVKKCRAALAQAVTGSDSWMESELRLLLEAHGIKPLVANEPVFDEEGNLLFEPDLSDKKNRVSIQYEGVHHGELKQIRSDINRQRRTRSAGWVEVRIFADDLYQFVEFEGQFVPRAVALVLLARLS